MKTTILIVHSDDGDRKGIHDILSHFDFDLIYANDGLIGLQAAKYLKPQLIISEIDLKLLNGITMAEMIRRDEQIGESSILFLHHRLDMDLIQAARKLSSKAFLIKPYVDNSLIYAVKRGLEQPNLTSSKNKTPVPYEECQMNRMNNQRYA